MAPQDDLTAERAAEQVIEDWKAYDPSGFRIGHLEHLITTALKTARQEALREAIKKIRKRGDEYMQDCEAKGAGGKKYRDTYEMRRVNSARAWAFKDLADELDRLASEGG